MDGAPQPIRATTQTHDATTTEERLERGELVYHPVAPFLLPAGEDHAFLLAQRLAGRTHKNISYNPATNEVSGFVRDSEEQTARLRALFARFSQSVITWLSANLPHYQGGIQPDRSSFRSEEEATRRVRRNARNDLLHVDAFPGRPARGRRILRVFVNIHPTEPRVWATSECLPRILDRFGDKVKRSSVGWFHRLEANVRRLVCPNDEQCASSDLFMLRLHDYLKRNLDFQQRGPRRLWRFPPGSAWLVMTDTVSHAELRGQFALEHSFFIAPNVLLHPELAPARLVG